MSDEESNGLADEEVDLGFYEGERNDDSERHGFGKAYFPNGDTYEGNYERGRRHGKGLYRLVSAGNGAQYDGNYAWNLKHGYGEMMYPDGARYEGYWFEDTRQGQGKYTYVNEDYYEGEWFENHKHGKGVYYHNDSGAKIEGTWEMGNLNGEMKIHFSDYSYQGAYDKNLVAGEGKFVFPKLSVEQTGRYVVSEKKLEHLDGEVGLLEEGEPKTIRTSKWEVQSLKTAGPQPTAAAAAE